MSTNDKELEFDELEDIELNSDEQVPQAAPSSESLDLSLSEDGSFTDFSLLDDENNEELEALPKSLESEEISLDETFEQNQSGGLYLTSLETEEASVSSFAETRDKELNPSETQDLLDLDDEQPLGEVELSQDAQEKLKEIDAIMDLDAPHTDLTTSSLSSDGNLDEPLVSDELDFGNFDFGMDDPGEAFNLEAEDKVEKIKKKQPAETQDRDLGKDLREISGAYSGEIERLQATLSNLRSDREELLSKIQIYQEEKVLVGRQELTLRAELDEKKIELTIIRRKLNEEIASLKDQLKLFDEKRLILEEKNKILMQELEKATQKNKMDVKRVQMRERELEQKLELLKSDAEGQIRNRDLKILELKRKIDAMEFDMESISMQEKRSIESRFELEDKLEKAIKTLRGAITVLEDESDRTNVLEALKKNIDM